MLTVFKQSWSHYKSHYAGLSSAIWRVILFNLIHSIMLSTCYFLPIYFVNHLKMTVATASIMIACYGVGTMLGGIISGKLSDKLSPITVCAGSLLLQGFSFLLLLLISSPILLMFTLFMLGIGAYGFITASYLTALSLCINGKTQRLKTINILDTTANLGLGLSALIIGALPIKHMPFLFLSISIMLIFLGALLPKTLRNQSGLLQEKEAPGDTTIKQYNGNPLLVYHVLCSLFIAGLIIAQLSSTYSIYLSTLFPTDRAAYFSMIFALNTFLVAFLQTPISHYINRFSHLSMTGYGTFLLGIGMSLLAFSQSIQLAFLSCVIYTIGEILFFSMAQSVCYENAPSEKKGTIIGSYRMIYATSKIAGPLLGGYIYQTTGSDALWIACGLLGSVCLSATLWLDHKLKQPFEYSHNP